MKRSNFGSRTILLHESGVLLNHHLEHEAQVMRYNVRVKALAADPIAAVINVPEGLAMRANRLPTEQTVLMVQSASHHLARRWRFRTLLPRIESCVSSFANSNNMTYYSVESVP